MSRNILNVVIDRVVSAVRVKIRNDNDDATWNIDASGRGAVAVESLKPDGVNTMPAMDAPARAGVVKITDGTNAFDAVAAAETITSKRGLPLFGALSSGAARLLNFVSSIGADGISGDTQCVPVESYLIGYNGATWDRLRSVNTGQLAVTQKDASGNTAPAADTAARAAFSRWVPSRPVSDLGASIVYFDHGSVAANYSADDATAKTQSANYDLWITDLSVYMATDPGAGGASVKIVITDTTDNEYRWFGSLSIHGNLHINFNTPLKITRGHQWRTTLYLGGATAHTIQIIINGYEEA